MADVLAGSLRSGIHSGVAVERIATMAPPAAGVALGAVVPAGGGGEHSSRAGVGLDVLLDSPCDLVPTATGGLLGRGSIGDVFVQAHSARAPAPDARRGMAAAHADRIHRRRRGSGSCVPAGGRMARMR